MATISNLAAKWYVTRFPSSNPHKGSVYAAANLAGSNTFHGLAVSAATGALGPSNSFLQMKMIDEPDLFYLKGDLFLQIQSFWNFGKKWNTCLFCFEELILQKVSQIYGTHPLKLSLLLLVTQQWRIYLH